MKEALKAKTLQAKGLDDTKGPAVQPPAFQLKADQTAAKGPIQRQAVVQKQDDPEKFFPAYKEKVQKCLDFYYNQESEVWKSFKKDHADLMLTGDDFADAAKGVYDSADPKDLKRIVPAEIAIAQCLNEGGLKPPTENSDLAINPFNVAKTDGGVKGSSAKGLDEIKKDKGWKEARKQGIANYYKLMYNKYMAAYDSPEKMLEYDSFNSGGNKEYAGRYATAFYYEAKIAGSVGLMTMNSDGKMLSGGVGGKKGNNADDLKAVYSYIQSYDKYTGRRQPTVKYADLVKLDGNGVPTVDSMNAALKEIQDKEIVPAEDTFSESKKKVAENMKKNAPVDYKQQTDSRASGVDGIASQYGTTIGYLYYYHKLMSDGHVFEGSNGLATTTTTPTTEPTKDGSEK